MFVNYAHRGASQYYPENTMSSFFGCLSMGPKGIETDIHMTKDGKLVLFHDDTLDRVTDGSGDISQYTYDELHKLTVFGGENGQLRDKIVLFEDFLRYFAHRDLMFAIELKQERVEKETIDLLEKYGMREKTILTSFIFDNLVRAREYNPNYRIGYLVEEVNDEVLKNLTELRGEQLCPHSRQVTEENVKYWHSLGFNVRAWGVGDPEIMKKTADAGVDGMTVNFPDLLTKYLAEK